MWVLDADVLAREWLAWCVAYGRILGFFMTAPWWSLRALGARSRIALTLLLAWSVHDQVTPPAMRADSMTADTVLFFVAEWLMGLVAGWVMRLGSLALELMAEVVAVQSGLSFAASQLHDNTLQSGLLGQLIGLSSLALVFVSNLHLTTLQWLLGSYHGWQPLHWPQAWDPVGVLTVFAEGFGLGVVWCVPVITVMTAINLVQAVLARLSPQFNLFTMGFALTVSVALVLLWLLLPALQSDAWIRLWQMPLEWLQQGWSVTPRS